ncbi:MAG TPA: dihydroxy-acid dehydratase, partial [Puia sp.]|nr:dihydroxy-acid dehydratase [Puia sp.]
MQKLRSHNWFYAANELGIQHKGALRSAGINMDGYSGQPIIGIANTWSELNNCNMSLRQIAAEVKKGVYEAGGIPLEFPVMSLGEELMKPSAMLYRNLLSMEVEENIRSYPLDGIVLLGNCDKTVPGLLMGAASANIPAIQLNGGPKKVGVFKGQRLGSGTDLWKYWDDLRMGKITDEEWEQIGKELSCGFGSCNTMGSASSLNGMLEVLGMMPLGLSTLPVESEERYTLTREAGKRIVDMVKEDWKPSDIMTINNFRNAIRICMALGGSTNSVIHLTAIAGRLNISLFPDEFEEIGKQVPCITDVQPSGNKLVDELNTAGGIPGVIKQLGSIIDLSAKTYTGKKLEELLNDNPVDQQIIRPVDQPLSHPPTLAVLKGNLAPRGALIKVSAADQNLLIHTGKAVVFEGYPDMLKRIDDPDLRVD